MEIINGLLKSIEDTDIVHGKVVIPEGVTTILENAFTKDYRIKSIICPKSLKVIEKRAFKDCSNLEEIYLNDGLLEIKNSAFTDCKNLEKIEIPIKLLKRLSEFYNTSTDYILGLTNEIKPYPRNKTN